FGSDGALRLALTLGVEAVGAVGLGLALTLGCGQLFLQRSQSIPRAGGIAGCLGPCCLGHLGLLLGLRGVVAGRLGRCGDLGLTRAGGLTVALGLGGLFEGAVALGLGGLPGPGGLDLAFVGRIALVLG